MALDEAVIFDKKALKRGARQSNPCYVEVIRELVCCVFGKPPFGRVGIEDKEGSITRLYLPGRSDAVSEGPETALLGEAFAQLEAYFAGRRKTFDLPLRFDEGTPFMKQVWQALCTVPYAHTASYKDIAEAVGNPKACPGRGHGEQQEPHCDHCPLPSYHRQHRCACRLRRRIGI